MSTYAMDNWKYADLSYLTAYFQLSIAYVDVNYCFANFKYVEGYVSIAY